MSVICHTCQIYESSTDMETCGQEEEYGETYSFKISNFQHWHVWQLSTIDRLGEHGKNNSQEKGYSTGWSQKIGVEERISVIHKFYCCVCNFHSLFVSKENKLWPALFFPKFTFGPTIHCQPLSVRLTHIQFNRSKEKSQ